MIIKMNYVNKLATEILSEYISKGYVLSSTMSGHQGEVYKVDAYKDNEIVRIRVDKGYSRTETEKKYSFEKAEVVYILVEKFENLNHTLWNGDGEELSYIEFYEVDRYKGIYCDNYSEYNSIREKQDARLYNNNNSKYLNIKSVLKIAKCTDKLLEIVQNTKGYKSVRKSHIKGIESFINVHNKKKYYKIMIDGKTDLIFNL